MYRSQGASWHRVANYFPIQIAKAAQPKSFDATGIAMNGNIESQVEHILARRHTPAAVVDGLAPNLVNVTGLEVPGARLPPEGGNA